MPGNKFQVKEMKSGRYLIVVGGGGGGGGLKQNYNIIMGSEN